MTVSSGARNAPSFCHGGIRGGALHASDTITGASCLSSPSVEIRYEQAVYGSFPFWDRGYAVLAHSPGCRPEWLAGPRAARQRYGERPAAAGRPAPRLPALRGAARGGGRGVGDVRLTARTGPVDDRRRRTAGARRPR